MEEEGCSLLREEKRLIPKRLIPWGKPNFDHWVETDSTRLREGLPGGAALLRAARGMGRGPACHLAH